MSSEQQPIPSQEAQFSAENLLSEKISKVIAEAIVTSTASKLESNIQEALACDASYALHSLHELTNGRWNTLAIVPSYKEKNKPHAVVVQSGNLENELLDIRQFADKDYLSEVKNGPKVVETVLVRALALLQHNVTSYDEFRRRRAAKSSGSPSAGGSRSTTKPGISSFHY